jgi:hypothetical protein
MNYRFTKFLLCVVLSAMLVLPALSQVIRICHDGRQSKIPSIKTCCGIPSSSCPIRHCEFREIPAQNRISLQFSKPKLDQFVFLAKLAQPVVLQLAVHPVDRSVDLDSSPPAQWFSEPQLAARPPPTSLI